jgi:hypothetical protein
MMCFSGAYDEWVNHAGFLDYIGTLPAEPDLALPDEMALRVRLEIAASILKIESSRNDRYRELERDFSTT